MLEQLLNKNLTRLEILKSKTDKELLKTVHISVYRNHSFEHMTGMINKFLNKTGLTAEFSFSDYDDSFNFAPLSQDNDLNLIWIDFSRYSQIDINTWFNERITALKSISKKPILIYYTGTNSVMPDCKDVVIVNSNDIEAEMGAEFFDIEKFEYSGTRLSSKASIRISQELGLKYLPSFFLTPIKAIVTDMDNTFYKGIIGEDGFDNIIPNLEYQKILKKLKDNGVLLSIASKNEYEDVKKLFELRKDFILKWDDFSSHNISWESKDKAILNTAKQFNIGIDSILFIDDNIGEINLVKNCYPKINTLIADDNLDYKINIYPLLERYTVSNEDKLRASDIDANQKRNEMFATMDKDEYFKSLEMVLTYSFDDSNHFERAIQLLNKTNQFIFSYARYSKEDITNKQHILTISLKDKLSDSGIIGIIVTEKNNENNLQIDEVVISCRALGRNIEDLMLNKAFEYLAKKLETSDDIIFNFKIGERNTPAKNWLQNYINKSIVHDCIVNAKIKNINENKYIKVEYKDKCMSY